jgi:hypothetical protein
VLDINDKNAINIPDDNFNEIEDKLFDYIGKELLSLNMSDESGNESESEDNMQSKFLSLTGRYSNLSSGINNAYTYVKKKKNSVNKSTRPDNECNLS